MGEGEKEKGKDSSAKDQPPKGQQPHNYPIYMCGCMWSFTLVNHSLSYSFTVV